jgi:nitrate reductase assembly molybdenum cofactor insertion protein NarJ
MNPFRYFSLVFSYPTEDTLRQITELSGNGNCASMRSRQALCGVALEEIQAEYTRMFISAYPALICPPYESYYREGQVYGASSIEAREWYRTNGLDFMHEGEPPDHLSVELEFLALTGNRAFLQRLRQWIYKFSERVKVNSAVYGSCAEDLEIFIKEVNPNSSESLIPERE